MICLGWMKSFKYNPIELLRQLNVFENERACEIVVEVLQEATLSPVDSELREEMKMELGESGIESFLEGMRSSITLTIDADSSNTDTSSKSLELEQLLFANSVLKQTEDANYKEVLITKLVSDIPTLCIVLERHASALVQFIQQKNHQKEEEFCFICQQLLRLACYHQATTLEEGSRRVFCVAMKSMLSNILTPDDLVEGCVRALLQFKDNSAVCFVGNIFDVTQDIITESKRNPDLLTNYEVRILSILSVALEHITPREAFQSKDIISDFATHVVPYVNVDCDTNALVQEAAVGCLGKLGLLSDVSLVETLYYPQLLAIAQAEEAALSIQIQALLALCDLSILMKTANAEFLHTIAKFLDHSNVAVHCIVAEVAIKLLLQGLVDESINSEWLGKLIVLFFEQAENNVPYGEPTFTDRGCPVRLQQLLSLFFPALCVQSQKGQDGLMGAIAPMLDIVVNNNSTRKNPESNDRTNTSSRKSARKSCRKGRKSKNLPIAKMIHFICTNVRIGEEVLSKKNADTRSDKEEEVLNEESSPELVAMIQVSQFLANNIEHLGTSTLRQLCTILGDMKLEVEKESCEHLSMLKESMEEVNMQLEDESFIKILRNLNVILDSLEFADIEEECSSETSLLNDDEQIKLLSLRQYNSRSRIHVDGDENNVPGLLLITPTNAIKGI
jgi:condensin complex subunit 3